jgi:NAD/NADP transhydrogenase alpha subunit
LNSFPPFSPDDDYKAKQKLLYAKMCKECDVVVSTALIPNRPAPIVITKDMVHSMRPGSVIVDLAAINGGNCEYTQADNTVITNNGVTILGKTNYPSEMAPQSSDFLARNFAAFLEVLHLPDAESGGIGGPSPRLTKSPSASKSTINLDAVERIRDGKIPLNMDDPIVRDSLCTFQGRIMYPPPRREQSKPAASKSPTDGNEANANANPPTSPSVVEGILTEETAETDSTPAVVKQLIKFMEDHKEQLAMGMGLAILLGLGLGLDIPEQEITHLGYFVLSLLIGHFTVASVTPALHTPLISVTNAISGIIVIGGMLQLSGPLMSLKVSCALLSIFFSSINIVGGFAVTKRMLDMFKSEKKQKA